MKKVLSGALFMLILMASISKAAYIPLEIIQPQTGLLDGHLAKNRFYKAYPGILYEVPVSVIGGTWPFTYSLLQSPPGMTIDPKTGVISWPSPQSNSVSGTTSCSSTHGCPVIAKVIDQEQTVKTVIWNIWVPTDVSTPAGSGGFLFVDSSAAAPPACTARTGVDSNVGSISRPLKSINDWYCGNTAAASNDSTYAGYIVYYRGGPDSGHAKTYQQDAYHDCVNRSCATPLYSNAFKPFIHIPYPGESVNMDMSTGGWMFDKNSTDAWMQGFNFINNAPTANFSCHTIVLEFNAGAGDTNPYPQSARTTVWKNNINGTPAKLSTGCNPAVIFFGEGDFVLGFNLNSAVIGNTCSNILSAECILTYGMVHSLIADNSMDTIYDPTGNGVARGISLKLCNSFVSVRNNRFSNIGTALYPDSIALEGQYFPQYNTTPCNAGGNLYSGNWDLSFNLAVTNIYGVSIDLNGDPQQADGSPKPGGPVWADRNTFSGGSVLVHLAAAVNGPWSFFNNVFINQRTEASHVGCIDGCVSAVIAPVFPAANGSIVSSSTTGIIDGSGNLISGYAQYTGTKGAQTTTALSAPIGATLTP